MAGIYIHIPFCKKACHYCDFHFSTTLKKKEEMIDALIKEIEIRKNELKTEVIETIYFGGGTPSILTTSEIEEILTTINKNYNVIESPEITLEANPDDLTFTKIIELSKTKINRLSIGIQSFYDEDLKLMNRAHNSKEAEKCLQNAIKHFNNITIDLIYGIPNMSNERWKNNINTALNLGISHISSYALTVEPKTALENFISKGIIDNPDEEKAHEHFKILVETLTNSGFIHYELSNFGKENFFSKHNTSYWKGKKYIGIGPSAHSFNGKQRSWNIANNIKYIKELKNNVLPSETEHLTKNDQYNEYIMTGLRTVWGISLPHIKTAFGKEYKNYLENHIEKYLLKDLLYLDNEVIRTTQKGKFLTDGIASDLFKIN